MQVEIGDRVNILGKKLEVVSFLGRGKGGYSYLTRDMEGKRYTLKCFHTEKVSYYSFSSPKIDCELNAYSFLISSSVPVPRLLYWDRGRDILLKEFVEGPTAMEEVKGGKDLSSYFPIMEKLGDELKRKGVNLDWFPTNFVLLPQGKFSYIDYEVNAYDDKWSFPIWSMEYWRDTPTLRAFLLKGHHLS